MAATKLTPKSCYVLLNSVKIPCLGFGSYLSPPNKTKTSCLAALKAGYSQIDTAQYYGNEKEVGEAVRESGIPRSELFVTTKILDAKGSVGKSYQSVLESVWAIDGEDGVMDLFLVHSALVGPEARKEQWLALERLYKEGKTRSIGVSNYGVGHIEEMKQYATVWPPHVNQLELHPWCQQREIVEYCQKAGVVVQAYSPLVRNSRVDDLTLKGIAERHQVTTAQVLVRYSLQKGWVPLPKSDTPSRIISNADVYSFALAEEEMRNLDALDQGESGSICNAVSNSL